MFVQAWISIVETTEFIRSAAHVLSSHEVDELKTFLAVNPVAGRLVPGAGGVRKLRWGAKRKGKRGGARVIYYYRNDRVPLYLLVAYSKDSKADLTEMEKQAFRSLVAVFKKERNRV